MNNIRLTSKQSSINHFNKRKAWRYFYPEGNGYAKPGYVLHHIDPSWRHTDIERYISWNFEDLVMITFSEHALLHKFGKNHTKEQNEKMRQKQFGNKYALGKHNISDEGQKAMGHWKGKKFPEETVEKMRQRTAEKNPAFGKHWWIKGDEKRFSAECPR